MQKLEDRMAELIDNGTAIQLFDPYPSITLTLAGALWLRNPPRLRWCAIFPEHQSHIHELHYTRVAFCNDGRDILFYQYDKIVAGVVPYEEGTLPVDEVRAALARWQGLLAVEGNEANFNEFLATA